MSHPISISLWLFLLLSSASLSKSKSVNKYLIPTPFGDLDENCFCFKTHGEYKRVPEIMNQAPENLRRVVVYFYEYKNTGKIKMYVPNKEKQELIPDLAFEVGDKFNTVDASTTVEHILDINLIPSQDVPVDFVLPVELPLGKDPNNSGNLQIDLIEIPSTTVYLPEGSDTSFPSQYVPVLPSVIVQADPGAKPYTTDQEIKYVDIDKNKDPSKERNPSIKYIIGPENTYEQPNDPINSDIMFEEVKNSKRPLYIDINNYKYGPDVAPVKPVIDKSKIIPIENTRPHKIIYTDEIVGPTQDITKTYIGDNNAPWQLNVITDTIKSEYDPINFPQDNIKEGVSIAEIIMPVDGPNNEWDPFQKLTVIPEKQSQPKNTMVFDKNEGRPWNWNMPSDPVIDLTIEQDPKLGPGQHINIKPISIDGNEGTPWNWNIMPSDPVIDLTIEQDPKLGPGQHINIKPISIDKNEGDPWNWNIMPSDPVIDLTIEQDPKLGPGQHINIKPISIDKNEGTPWNLNIMPSDPVIDLTIEQDPKLGPGQHINIKPISIDKNEGNPWNWNIMPSDPVIDLTIEQDPKLGPGQHINIKPISIDKNEGTPWNWNIMPSDPVIDLTTEQDPKLGPGQHINIKPISIDKNEGDPWNWNIMPSDPVIDLTIEQDPKLGPGQHINIKPISIDKNEGDPWNWNIMPSDPVIDLTIEQDPKLGPGQHINIKPISIDKNEGDPWNWNIMPSDPVIDLTIEQDPKLGPGQHINIKPISIDKNEGDPWNWNIMPSDPVIDLTIEQDPKLGPGQHINIKPISINENEVTPWNWNIMPSDPVIDLTIEQDPKLGPGQHINIKPISINENEVTPWNWNIMPSDSVIDLTIGQNPKLGPGQQHINKKPIFFDKNEGVPWNWNIPSDQVIGLINEQDPNKAKQPSNPWDIGDVEPVGGKFYGLWNNPYGEISGYVGRPSIVNSNAAINRLFLSNPNEEESVEVPFILDLSTEVADDDNKYVTFDSWFAQQMKRFKTYTELGKTINILTIERYILKILQDNGMHVTPEGVLADSFGTALDVHKLQLRPILIGSTVALGTLLQEKARELKMPSNMTYLQAILVTNSDPSLLLGIIPLGKTLIPSKTIKPLSDTLEPYVLNSLWSKLDQLRSEKNVQSIMYKGLKTNYKDIITKPGKIRKGKTIITVVKEAPKVIKLHNSYRQPMRTYKVIRTSNSGEKEYVFSEDSAEAMKSLIDSIQDGKDPIKSAEATNQLLVSLRSGDMKATSTTKNSDEVEIDGDISPRIVGGFAATSSGVPLSVKGRMKDVKDI